MEEKLNYDELVFDVLIPVCLDNLAGVIIAKKFVLGVSLDKIICDLFDQKINLWQQQRVKISNIENKQKILDWLRPFVLKEKENVKQKLMEEIEHLEFMAENVSDDLKKSKDELMQLENLEI